MIVLSIAGCGSTHPVAKIFNNSRACYANIEKQPEAKIVREQIIPAQDANPGKIYDLMNSTALITEEQKRPLAVFIMMDTDCDNQLAAALVGTPWQKPRLELNKELHAQYKGLLGGWISIGSFNTKFKALMINFAAENQKAKSEDIANQAGAMMYLNNLQNPYGSGNIFIYQGQ